MSRKWIVAAIFVVAGVGIWLLARRYLTLEMLVEQELRLRAAIESQPLLAFVIGFVIYTVVSVFPGTSGKSIICGWLFGFWQALVMVTVALTLAGLVGFNVSRYVLRETIRRRFPEALSDLDEALENDGPFYLLTVRMLHVPFTLVNYLCGASGLPARTFAWTTAVGLIPSTMIFVGLGASLPSLKRLADEGVKGLIEPPLLIALVLMGLAPWVLRFIVRQFSAMRSPERSADGGASADGVAP